MIYDMMVLGFVVGGGVEISGSLCFFFFFFNGRNVDIEEGLVN